MRRRAAISSSTRSLADRPDCTLLAVLDRTATAMGGRELRRWLHRPLRDRRRASSCALQAIGALIDAGDCTKPCANCCAHVGDVERILARVALRSARPRDLAQLRDALGALPALRDCSPAIDAPLLQRLARAGAARTRTIHALLARAIVEAPPAMLRDGGVIAAGYDAELDELQRISEHSDQYLLDLEARERERSGIANLRLGYNRVQGYYIEISRSQADRVPADYHRRQTVKNAERYITPELKEFEDKVLGARERALAREKRAVRRAARSADRPARRAAGDAPRRSPRSTCSRTSPSAPSTLRLARRRSSPTSRCIEISGGRHPVVEQFIDEPFVPNDLHAATTSAACWSSPARTWAASRRTCARPR